MKQPWLAATVATVLS